MLIKCNMLNNKMHLCKLLINNYNMTTINTKIIYYNNNKIK
jgi:hypothetical protein